MGQPPSAATVQICGVPLMFVMNAIRLPSGENDGEPQDATFAIKATEVSSSSAAVKQRVRVNTKSRSVERTGPPVPRNSITVGDLKGSRLIRVSQVDGVWRHRVP